MSRKQSAISNSVLHLIGGNRIHDPNKQIVWAQPCGVLFHHSVVQPLKYIWHRILPTKRISSCCCINFLKDTANGFHYFAAGDVLWLAPCLGSTAFGHRPQKLLLQQLQPAFTSKGTISLSRAHADSYAARLQMYVNKYYDLMTTVAHYTN